jgi:hypothetical protein
MRRALIGLVVVTCLAVTLVAGVFLSDRAERRAAGERLREVRLQLEAATVSRQGREMDIDRGAGPGSGLQPGHERRARYERDPDWRQLDRMASDLRYEEKQITDRWPDLR